VVLPHRFDPIIKRGQPENLHDPGLYGFNSSDKKIAGIPIFYDQSVGDNGKKGATLMVDFRYEI